MFLFASSCSQNRLRSVLFDSLSRIKENNSGTSRGSWFGKLQNHLFYSETIPSRELFLAVVNSAGLKINVVKITECSKLRVLVDLWAHPLLAKKIATYFLKLKRNEYQIGEVNDNDAIKKQVPTKRNHPRLR